MNNKAKINRAKSQETNEANQIAKHDKIFKERINNDPIYRTKMNNFVKIIKQIYIKKDYYK